jgi:protoheme IX farnesyltransferase
MLKHFAELLKFKLSATVVFSAIVGYLLGFDNFDIHHFLYLILGGFLVTGSANTFNQIIEVEKDKLMQRTAVRPLPKGNLTVLQATIFALFTALFGLLILNKINPQGTFYGVMSKSSFFGLISIFLYVLSYTPLKRVSTISIFVGAVPGAIPFLLGYVAATDDFGLAAGTLFAIQFFWQFPHFIAIAWVQNDDYKKAGFKMLPTGEKDKGTALQIIAYIIWTILICITPAIFNIGRLTISNYAAVLIIIIGLIFLYYGFRLFKNQSSKEARKLMLVSILFLTSVQLIYVIDKFI